LVPGGSGNIAVAAALLGLKNVFIGKAGKDHLGKMYESDLKSYDVTTKILFDKKASTGIVISLTQGAGERSFAVFRGANDGLTSKEIFKNYNSIASSRYLYVNGFSLVSETMQNSITTAVAIACKNDVKIVFDPGAFNLFTSREKLFNDLLNSCHIFCPNLQEALVITNTETLESAIEVLRKKANIVTLKLGEKGSIFVHGDESFFAPSHKVTAVDTTGAGDAFIAAVLYGISKNLPYPLILTFANWYAAQVTSSLGARGYPSKKQVCTFFKYLKKNVN
jgi:fructokinase